MSEPGRRLLAFAVGVLWLGLAGWVYLFGIALVGVSIDPGATPIPGWLATATAMGLFVLAAHRRRLAMIVSVVGALFLAADVVRSMAGSTPDIIWSLTSIAAVAVLIGLVSIAAIPSGGRGEPWVTQSPR
jgi:hypothetical protein